MKLTSHLPLVDFLDAEALAGEHGGDVDLLAVHAQAADGALPESGRSLLFSAAPLAGEEQAAPRPRRAWARC
jgi:hypothetical protein